MPSDAACESIHNTRTTTRADDLDLFAPHGFGTVTLRFEFTFELPPAEQLSSVHLVPFVGDGMAVTARTADDHWIMPGGTIEPGERWQETAARELREETGARVLDVVPFGILRGHDASDRRPWRPHLPWPDFCWVIGAADVVIDGGPTDLDGSEPILEVACLPVDEAARRVGRDWAAGGAIYRLAADVRANACGLGRRWHSRPSNRGVALEDRRPHAPLGQLA